MGILILILLVIIFMGILIYLENKFNYPFGFHYVVICPIPPFIKRIKIKNKWIGFDKNWRFIFFKEMKLEKEAGKAGD